MFGGNAWLSVLHQSVKQIPEQLRSTFTNFSLVPRPRQVPRPSPWKPEPPELMADMSGPQAHATLRAWIKEKMHVTSPALLWFLLRGYILNGSSVTKGMLEVTCTNSFFYLFGDSLMPEVVLMLLSCHNHELSSGDKNVSACNFNSQPRNLRHSIKNLAKNNYSVKCRRIDGDTAASPPLLAATLHLTNNVIINPGNPSCQ